MSTLFSPETFTPVDHFSREVQIDRDEFLRQLPGAIDNRVYKLHGDLVTIPESGGQICIRMNRLPDSRLGKLTLPMMRLDFAFDGMTDTEIDTFMDGYDQRTLRGSGGM